MRGGPEAVSEPGSTKEHDARRLCAELLEELAATFGTVHGVLYAVADRERLVVVVESGERPPGNRFARHEHQWHRDERADLAAMRALRSGRRIVTSGEYRTSGDFVAVPCIDDREVVAVAVVRGVEGARRQLDVYAIDLRATYLAERDRSLELASALDELTQTYGSTVRGLARAVTPKQGARSSTRAREGNGYAILRGRG